ncbi:MAG: hypothetical protein QM534_09895 [Sediminibacterium sp.]|nr:hypothetical protein [Sediminibacterium sp.]
MDSQRVCKHILFFASHNAIALKNKMSLQANPPDRADIIVNLTLQTFGLRRRTTGNSTFAIGGVSFSADSFVQAESFVLRINICAENPAHRKSAKRYAKCYEDRATDEYL